MKVARFPAATSNSARMISAQDALARLKDGNRRFVTGERKLDTGQSHAERAAAARNQSPFAIVLGCSDARVPAEVVFDQGLGDLFVIRVAGNVVARNTGVPSGT